MKTTYFLIGLAILGLIWSAKKGAAAADHKAKLDLGAADEYAPPKAAGAFSTGRMQKAQGPTQGEMMMGHMVAMAGYSYGNGYGGPGPLQ